MPAERFEQDLDRVLAGYSRVEPGPEALRRWAQPPTAAPRRRVSTAVWATLAAAAILLLALTWYHSRNAGLTQPTLAGRHTVLVPAAQPSGASTADQQKLLKMLQSNPSALAAQKPTVPPKPIAH
ncbi:MAG: hypothetical protein ACRD2D_00925 [Terriglobales bacterium]